MKYLKILTRSYKLVQAVSSCHINFSSSPTLIGTCHFHSFSVIILPGMQTLHCLDCFGASQRVKTCWEKHGYSACAFDLKLNEQHDLSLFSGCVELLRILFMSLGSVFIESYVAPMEYRNITCSTLKHNGIIHIYIILYHVLLFFDQGRSGSVILYCIPLCACPPSVSVCSEASRRRHGGGWATM